MPRVPHLAFLASFSALMFVACAGSETENIPRQDTFEITGSDGTKLRGETLGVFEEPWALAFLPNGNLLITEKDFRMVLVESDGNLLGEIQGVPTAEVVGQGGFADVTLHPDFETNGQIYISYIETEENRSGSIVQVGNLVLNENGGTLSDLKTIWTQTPKLDGGRHFSQRLIFDRDGYLFITSGDRGRKNPSQEMDNNLGKIIRLHADGSIPEDNPFAGQGGVKEQFWSIGHRNPLGIALDGEGYLWSNEMGPRGGDELNRIVKGENYGWPIVSDGRNYVMTDIPDHDTREDFKPPAISWVPSISPSSLMIYDGPAFSDWQGDALLSALSGEAIVRVSITGEKATEEARYAWGERVRAINIGADGSIYALEDGFEGRLIRITPPTN